jgi:hypothetical protein
VTASVLDGLAGFRAQMLLWGYAISGDACEFSAILAEDSSPPVLEAERAWDRTAAHVAGWLVSHGDELPRPVKEFAALPWVTEHLIRAVTGGPCCPGWCYPVEWPGL